MKKKQSNLDQLKGKNPFTVPQGYMEGLTSQIMSQLPEKPKQEAKIITMRERVRPWLYMAAVFAGLVLLFRAIVGITGSDGISNGTDSLLVHTTIPAGTYSAFNDEQYDEDEEYLEYIENQYASYILAEELAFSE